MQHDIKRKTLIIIWILVMILFSMLAIIGSVLFSNFYLILFIPLSFCLVVAFQAMSEHFWTPKKYCPRCNGEVSIYSEFCRNCGLKLLNICPQCKKIFKAEIIKCDRCGLEIPKIEEKIEPIEYSSLEKGFKIPEKANFCPHCGSILRHEKVNEICPFCNGRID